MFEYSQFYNYYDFPLRPLCELNLASNAVRVPQIETSQTIKANVYFGVCGHKSGENRQQFAEKFIPPISIRSRVDRNGTGNRGVPDASHCGRQLECPKFYLPIFRSNGLRSSGFVNAAHSRLV